MRVIQVILLFFFKLHLLNLDLFFYVTMVQHFLDRGQDGLGLALLAVAHDDLSEFVVDTRPIDVHVVVLEVVHDLSMLDVKLSEVFTGQALEAFAGQLAQVIPLSLPELRVKVEQCQRENLAVGSLSDYVFHQRDREDPSHLEVFNTLHRPEHTVQELILLRVFLGLIG